MTRDERSPPFFKVPFDYCERPPSISHGFMSTSPENVYRILFEVVYECHPGEAALTGNARRPKRADLNFFLVLDRISDEGISVFEVCRHGLLDAQRTAPVHQGGRAR